MKYKHDFSIKHMPNFIIGALGFIFTVVVVCMIGWVLSTEAHMTITEKTFTFLVGVLNFAGAVSFMFRFVGSIDYTSTLREPTTKDKLLDDEL